MNERLFTRRHPEYIASEAVWQRSAAAYSGGAEYFVETDYPIKKEMIEALDLVGIPLTEATGSVTLKFGSDEMELFTQSTSVGEGRDKLMLPYQGEPFQLALNLSYLLEPFKYSSEDTLTMKINDHTSPVMLSNGDFRYIVMPIRTK